MKRFLSTQAFLLFAVFVLVAAAGVVFLPHPWLALVLCLAGLFLVDRHWRRELAKIQPAPAPVVEERVDLPDAAPFVSRFNPPTLRVFRCGECCAPSGEPHEAICSQAGGPEA